MRALAPAPDFPDARPELPAPSAAMQSSAIGLRPAMGGDLRYLRTLYGALRGGEPGFAAIEAAARDDFLDWQFRLQHAHFVRHYPGADFLIVVRAAPPLRAEPVGRLYLDRAAPLWRLVEIGLDPCVQARGLGSMLILWLQAAARGARAGGIDLHVAHDNPRAAALYHRLGFREAPGDSTTHLRMAWPA